MLSSPDLGLFVLRIAVAAVFIYHGLPKLKKFKMMAQGMGFPASFVLLLGLTETVSSLGLIFGYGVRLAAALLAIVMIGAIYFKTQKWHIPFAAQDKTGWEFDLILLAANVAIVLTDGGSFLELK